MRAHTRAAKNTEISGRNRVCNVGEHWNRPPWLVYLGTRCSLPLSQKHKNLFPSLWQPSSRSQISILCFSQIRISNLPPLPIFLERVGVVMVGQSERQKVNQEKRKKDAFVLK